MMHGVHRALPAVPGSESTVKPKLPATTTVPVVPCIVVQVSRGYPAEAPSLKMTVCRDEHARKWVQLH